jgi:predicted DsbA family dithiol-disulfide isomerase
LKKEYGITENWISYELHPETPPEGILLSERFRGYDVTKMYDNLRKRGQEVGIVFGNRVLLSNSRLALEASEFARDAGMYDSFHEQIFHAYFTDALDIGNAEVISSIAAKCGLDVAGMMNALGEGRYRSRLIEARQEGEKIHLTGVPTFVIDGKCTIVGAQPIETFRDVFKNVDQ